MSKKVSMNAETGKVGSNNQPVKSFELKITLDKTGKLQFHNGGAGFNDYEILGFIELFKSSITNKLVRGGKTYKCLNL